MGIARGDGMAATEFLDSLPVELQMMNPGKISFALIQNGGEPAAEQWIKNLAAKSHETEAATAFDQALGNMIYTNVENAATWVTTPFADAYFDAPRQQNFAAQFSQRAPDKAADWAIASGRDNLLPEIVNSCPDSKFNEMGNWLTAHADSEFFSTAAELFANRIESSDPDAAIKWREAAAGK